jgi:hypothetical protein
VIGQFRLVEFPAWRKGKNGVDEDRDALVLKEMKDASGVF